MAASQVASDVFSSKDRKKLINLHGTRTSVVKNQLLLSTGLTSLDSIIGGGLPVGTILLIEEDEHAVFSHLFIRYFLAEGVVCSHGLYVASLDDDPKKTVADLPSPVTADVENSNISDNSDLKIAWRYKSVPRVESSPSPVINTAFGHNFDLTKPLSKEALINTEVQYWPLNEGFITNVYSDLLKHLQGRIRNNGHSTETTSIRKSVLRVAVNRLGTPLWPNADAEVPRFLYCLRAILRHAYSSCIITLPTSILKEETVERCEHLSDYVISLVSLANSSNPAYSEYNGLLAISKLAAINTLASHVPETRDWAFKLRKKRFIIEKLHLPPELQESQQREQDEDVGVRLMCSSGGSSALDF